jgi:tetratricopeptide (TPR) repeat protein
MPLITWRWAGCIYKKESARRCSFERACQLEAQQAETGCCWRRPNRQGELESAAASAERAAHLAADPTAALLLRGEIALLLNKLRSAPDHAQAVLRRNARQPRCIVFALQSIGGFEPVAGDALEALEKALPHLDGGLAAQIERARLLRQTQGLETALAALQSLSATYPAHPLLYTLLAEWLVEAGREDEALQTARLALQADHDELPARRRADLHYLLGVQMRRLGQLDQSVHHLNESIQRHPQHMETYLELGRTYQERREYKQALCIYQQAIEMAQEDYRPYYQAAMALKEGKDYLEAESMLRRAAQLAPEDVNVHRLLGAVVARIWYITGGS